MWGVCCLLPSRKWPLRGLPDQLGRCHPPRSQIPMGLGGPETQVAASSWGCAAPAGTGLLLGRVASQPHGGSRVPINDTSPPRPPPSGPQAPQPVTVDPRPQGPRRCKPWMQEKLRMQETPSCPVTTPRERQEMFTQICFIPSAALRICSIRTRPGQAEWHWGMQPRRQSGRPQTLREGSAVWEPGWRPRGRQERHSSVELEP